MTKIQQSERDKYRSHLRETLKPGDTLYTVLRHVSRSGMSRVIDVYQFTPDGVDKRWLSYQVAKAAGMSLSDSPQGIKIGGCGMDMGFHIVYSLGRALWPEGFATIGSHPIMGSLRPLDRDKVERARAAGYTFHGRNGDPSGWDNDGGYALRQEWI